MVISYCYGNMEMDEMANNSLLTYIYHTSIIYHIITTAWCSMCADPSDVPIQRTGVLTSNNLTWTVERWTHFFRPCQTSVFEAVAHHFPSESPAISSHLHHGFHAWTEVSFVNSICTIRGGTHVTHVSDQIVEARHQGLVAVDGRSLKFCDLRYI
jgi:hypothetical protein